MPVHVVDCPCCGASGDCKTCLDGFGGNYQLVLAGFTNDTGNCLGCDDLNGTYELAYHSNPPACTWSWTLTANIPGCDFLGDGSAFFQLFINYDAGTNTTGFALSINWTPAPGGFTTSTLTFLGIVPGIVPCNHARTLLQVTGAPRCNMGVTAVLTPIP